MLAEHWCCSVRCTRGNMVSETCRGVAQLQRAYLHRQGADGRLELDKLLLSNLVCAWGGGANTRCLSLVLTNSYSAVVQSSHQAGMAILSPEWSLICGPLRLPRSHSSPASPGRAKCLVLGAPLGFVTVNVSKVRLVG